MIRKILSKQVIAFLIIGGFNTLLDMGIYWYLVHNGLHIIVANTISTSIGMLSGFMLNRTFAFQSKETKAHKQIIPFTLVTSTGLWVLQPIIIHAVAWLIEQLGMQTTNILYILTPKLIATGFSMIWNFLLYKYVVFQDKDASEEKN